MDTSILEEYALFQIRGMWMQYETLMLKQVVPKRALQL
jgi:hypothetical protein